MTNLGKLVLTLIVIGIVGIGAVLYYAHTNTPPATASNTATSTLQTYGMTEYTDPTYAFTFWYPSSVSVTATTTDSTTNFPGGTQVERIEVGPPGGTSISVVRSASSTIKDEPNGHAAPIAQTEYFYDISSGHWMVAYPEGSQTGTSSATTTADISKTTVGGLPMLPSGARFDTTIIPLSTTEFLVIQDGGGSPFTAQLAATVATQGAAVDGAALSNALQAESTAASNQ